MLKKLLPLNLIGSGIIVIVSNLITNNKPLDGESWGDTYNTELLLKLLALGFGVLLILNGIKVKRINKADKDA